MHHNSTFANGRVNYIEHHDDANVSVQYSVGQIKVNTKSTT